MAESAQRSNVVWLALEGRREWVGGRVGGMAASQARG